MRDKKPRKTTPHLTANAESARKFTFRQTLRVLARALRVMHGTWPGFLSLTSATSAMNALKPLIALFMSARILNELTGGRDVRLIVLYVAVTVVSVFLLSAVGALLNQRLNMRNGYTYSQLEFLYVKRYMEMDYPRVEDSQVNQALADIRARAGGNGLGLLMLQWSLPSLLTNVITLLVSLALLAGLFTATADYARNWLTSPASSWLLALLAAISLVSPLLIRRIDKAALELSLRENPKANTLFGFYSEYKNVKNAAKDIRLYNQAGTLADIFDKRLNLKMWFWCFSRWALSSGLNGLVNAFVGGAVYLFIGLRALYGMYAIGSVVQYVGAVTSFIGNMAGLSGNLAQITNNLPYMQNIFDYLDQSDPAGTGNLTPDAGRIEIEFDNVSFRYPGAEDFALKNISLRFTPGQRLAVVGMNGSGKTTMVKLLCRLYQPTAGVIRLNGADIQSYAYADYLRLFNVVFQDFKLFSLGLGANVAVSAEYDRDRAAKALHTAGFGDKLASLEKGLDTMLNKDCDKEGTTLSGGEEQKVAIARAIYRDSPFVVFDEPTAALDPISEYEVYTKLNDIVGGKTAVFISHRLSSCRFCDEIAVFHKGRIIQRGGHEELLADTGGKYAEMWHAQAQYYVGRTQTAGL